MLVVRSFSAFTGIRFVLWIPGSASFRFALSPSFSFWLWAPCRKLKAKKFKHATETSGCQWVRMDQDEQMVRWTCRARRTLHQVFCQTIRSDLQEPVIEVGEESLWTQKSKKWWQGCSISISIGFCADEFRSQQRNLKSLQWKHILPMAPQNWLGKSWGTHIVPPPALISQHLQPRNTTTYQVMKMHVHLTTSNIQIYSSAWSSIIQRCFLTRIISLVKFAKESEMHSWFDPCTSWLSIKTKQFQSQRYKSYTKNIQVLNP